MDALIGQSGEVLQYHYTGELTIEKLTSSMPASVLHSVGSEALS